jgi:bifunctional non-homologous end joining protein LigD
VARSAATTPFPDAIAPMLATLTDRRELGDGWLLERKLDGERLLAFVRGDDVALRTRTRRDVTAAYPEVVAALARQRLGAAVLDGELCAVDADGDALGFQALQRRLGVADPPAALVDEAPVALWLFDLLHRDGRDLRPLGTAEREAALGDAIRPAGALVLTRHEDGDSASAYAAACRAGWEGIIAKRADAPYAAGRSRDWLKLKCLFAQELVVGGFTEPRGARTGFGALLVGYHDDGELRYAGKVGTGFGVRTLDALAPRLRKLERRTSPFADARPVPPGTHWVRPALVAQIAFAEWTRDGRLRQPRFQGLRDDKDPADVVREHA